VPRPPELRIIRLPALLLLAGAGCMLGFTPVLRSALLIIANSHNMRSQQTFRFWNRTKSGSLMNPARTEPKAHSVSFPPIQNG